MEPILKLSKENCDLDLSKLTKLVEQKEGILSFSKNKDKFEKYANNLYVESETDYFWKLEKDPYTGEELIVRTSEKNTKKQSKWSAAINKGRTTITLAYNNLAIKTIKKADLELQDDSDLEEWRDHFLDRIEEDPSVIKEIIANLSEERKTFLREAGLKT